MRFDLHLHTHHSYDCLTSYDAILRAVERAGLDGIAVTDHNRLRGALDLARLAPFPVIVGEEIRTREGEIIGYFLQEEIPRGLGLEESIARVREQGGVVAVPHPLDSLRMGSAIGEAALLRVMDQIDIIEGLNARCLRPDDNRRAQALAARYGKGVSAGSDAHHPSEIGRCVVEIAPFDGPASFVAALREARLHGRESAPTVKLFSTGAKLLKRLRRAR